MTALEVALALAGAVVGAGVAWGLRRWDYRLDDERNLPVRRPMPWLVPAMALAWGLLGWRLGDLGHPGLLPAYLFFATLSGALVAIDVDVHRLPDALQLPAMPVLVTLLAIASWASGDWWALARAVIAWGVLLVGYFVLVLISPGAQGLGLGDVKLAGILGLVLGWLGWFPLLIGVYAGFLVGGLFALVLVLGRRAGWSSSVAYGPPMIVGGFVGILLPVELVADLLLG